MSSTDYNTRSYPANNYATKNTNSSAHYSGNRYGTSTYTYGSRPAKTTPTSSNYVNTVAKRDANAVGHQLTKSEIGLVVGLMVLEEINFYLADPVKLASFARYFSIFLCSCFIGKTNIRF